MAGPKYQISQTAYVKLVLHALKHRTSAVNGVLVGSVRSPVTESNGEVTDLGSGTVVEIFDAVPLSHEQLGLLPMLELALSQIDEHWESQKDKLQIVGYYHANERYDDHELAGLARKIGDHIARHCSQACILLLDNRLLEALPKSGGRKPVVQIYTRDASRGWRTPSNGDLVLKEPMANDILQDYISEGRDQSIVDFDDHLNDISKDWLNPELFQ